MFKIYMLLIKQFKKFKFVALCNINYQDRKAMVALDL